MINAEVDMPIPDRLFERHGYPTLDHEQYMLSHRWELGRAGLSFGARDKFILGGTTGKSYWFTMFTGQHCEQLKKHGGEDSMWIEGEIFGGAAPAEFRYIHLRRNGSYELALAVFAQSLELYRRTARLGVALGSINFGETRVGNCWFTDKLPTLRDLLVLAILEPGTFPLLRCSWSMKSDPSSRRLLDLWMASEGRTRTV